MFHQPRQCPTCQQGLETRELVCPACATVVRGQWVADPLSRLNPDQVTFLLLFVRSRGNLSDVERTLGVSYPTVRAKLDEVIGALGAGPPGDGAAVSAVAPATAPVGRAAILDQVARGRLSIDEALAQLRPAAPAKERS